MRNIATRTSRLNVRHKPMATSHNPKMGTMVCGLPQKTMWANMEVVVSCPNGFNKPNQMKSTPSERR